MNLSPFLNTLSSFKIPKNLNISLGNTISIHSQEVYPQQKELHHLISSLTPWLKGPFNLMGTLIESQWNSSIKYHYIEKILPSLEGKDLLDVGCNNGYYLFRLLEKNPASILGIDPIEIYYQQFSLIQYFIQSPTVEFKLKGFEDIPKETKKFDIIFCLGILYHHTDPISILKILKNALKEKGKIIIETMTIPIEEPYCLVPKKKYGGSKGMWFIPSISALKNWIHRCGFEFIEVFHEHPLSKEEQRQTPLNPFPTFTDYILENGYTQEGYLAPNRTYLEVRR